MKVTVRFDAAKVQETRARLGRDAFLKLLREVARDMADQVRVNIIKHGEPGGDWAPLSGFNQRQEERKAAKKKLKEGRKTLSDHEKRVLRRRAGEGQKVTAARADAKSYGKRASALRRSSRGLTSEKRINRNGRSLTMAANQRKKLSAAKQKVKTLDTKARNARKVVEASRHSGYAKEKALGKTPGHGRFGADVRLRDSERLYRALNGTLVASGANILVTLVAPGSYPDGTSVEQVLEWHIEGTEKMPARNPIEDMGLFERRVKARLEAVTEGL